MKKYIIRSLITLSLIASHTAMAEERECYYVLAGAATLFTGYALVKACKNFSKSWTIPPRLPEQTISVETLRERAAGRTNPTLNRDTIRFHDIALNLISDFTQEDPSLHMDGKTYIETKLLPLEAEIKEAEGCISAMRKINQHTPTPENQKFIQESSSQANTQKTTLQTSLFTFEQNARARLIREKQQQKFYAGINWGIAGVMGCFATYISVKNAQ
jgi:NADH dehydrogenase/NADH:ubiquinone oxidoreductase subunit G